MIARSHSLAWWLSLLVFLQWHHEPHHWAVSTLWAIDDFTPENGGTRLFPYSHRNRMREGGREMMEGSYKEEEVTKLSMPRCELKAALSAS
jgi:ectoine hydroxylase-related dioxygenase (phytanoyl-CoA dioxygenase family)|eukprot:COSAG02_NODE_11853_length_1642_cov_18.217110_2_plen_91_part_00